MCHFISWVEYKNQIFYLNDTKLNTKEGRALKKQLGKYYHDDITGHGAIRAYYPELKNKGRDKECTNFSTPDNFPPEIVADIKTGKFKLIGFDADLLCTKARGEYDEIRSKAWYKYDEIRSKACREYGKIEPKAWEEYVKIESKAWEEYVKIEPKAWEEYVKIISKAEDDYDEIRSKARDEYEKIRSKAFWNLFVNPKNRIENWG